MGQEEEVKEEVSEDQETIVVKIDIEGKGRNYLETFHCSSSSPSRREERERYKKSGRLQNRRRNKEMPGGKHLYNKRGLSEEHT